MEKGMKKFKLIANYEFYAKNIDDAFLKLSTHFENISDLGIECDTLKGVGEIKIVPIEENL